MGSHSARRNRIRKSSRRDNENNRANHHHHHDDAAASSSSSSLSPNDAPPAVQEEVPLFKAVSTMHNGSSNHHAETLEDDQDESSVQNDNEQENPNDDGNDDENDDDNDDDSTSSNHSQDHFQDDGQEHDEQDHGDDDDDDDSENDDDDDDVSTVASSSTAAHNATLASLHRQIHRNNNNLRPSSSSPPRRLFLSRHSSSFSRVDIPDWPALLLNNNNNHHHHQQKTTKKKLTDLALVHHAQVRADNLQFLVEFLLEHDATRETLRSLDLSNNHLGAKGMESLGRLLAAPEHHTTLATLRLARNGLKGRRAMRYLTAALATNPAVLRVLDVSHNALHDKSVTTDVAALLDSRQVDCRLQELDLSNNGSTLTDKSAWALGGALIQGHNTTLQILRLSGNALGPNGGDALGTLLKLSHSLQELYVANCNLNDRGVQYICQGLIMAENEPALRVLDVAWNVLHDDAAVALANLLQHNSTLQRIQLECNGIGDKGAAALAASLPRSDSLQTLDVRGNQIHDAGAIALAVALADTRTCDGFALHWEMNAHMTDVGRHRIQGALQLRTSRKVWLNALLKNLTGVTRFPALNCGGTSSTAPCGDDEVVEICKHVATQQRQAALTLPVVRFKGPGITLRGVKAIANQLLCPQSVTLTHLYLLHTHMGDDGANLLAQALLRNKSLTTLTCMNCEWTDDGAVYLSRALPRHGRLGRLDLRQNRIGTEGARALFHAITEETPSLHTLYLSKNRIGDLAVRSLSAIGQLVTLNLADNLLTDAAALDLARICGNIVTPQSSSLHAVNNNLSGTDGYNSQRYQKHEIKWLDVSRNFLTPRGMQALDIFLPDLCTLDASDQQATTTPLSPAANGKAKHK